MNDERESPLTGLLFQTTSREGITTTGAVKDRVFGSLYLVYYDQEACLKLTSISDMLSWNFYDKEDK